MATIAIAKLTKSLEHSLNSQLAGITIAIDRQRERSLLGQDLYGQTQAPAGRYSDVATGDQHSCAVHISGSYRSGRTARLTAAPADGYRFVRWIGAVSGTSARVSLTVNEDKSVIAVFDVVSDRDETPMLEDGAMLSACRPDGLSPAG